ncbi:MAG: hypothetical protein H7Y02_11380 [Candidatus Obscuribacterales bacterium]|nr:hypothetical protein [Steroidobacteraceae bacterium]
MSGSVTTSVALPKPLEITVRFLVAGAAVLWLGGVFERAIVESSLPLVRAVFEFVDDDFTVLGLDVAHEGANETLRLKADYSHPIYLEGVGTFIYPMNLDPRTAGWLQVNLTVGGLLQYGLLMLIVVLAWPARGIREMLVRLGLSLPLLAVFLLVAAISTLLAELWNPLHQDFAPQEFWPLLAWSRFLMGGGGAMLALVIAGAAIRWSSPYRLTRD